MKSSLPRAVLLSLLAQLGLASASSTAIAQGPAAGDIVRANLEPSYLVVPFDLTGLDPVWYEANVVTHLVVHRATWPLAVVLTPKIVLRLFRSYSDPVKTPSYMPRLALFWWLDPPDERRGTFRYASFTVLHHSNGQAGPVFLPGRKVNHDDGDFYTNAIELALHAFEPTLPAFRWMKIALEWHPWLVQQQDIVGRYSGLRLQLDATVLEHPSFGGSLHAGLGVLLGSFEHNGASTLARQLERFPLSVAYAVAFDGSDIALFARYYAGRDYYNIWFDRTIHVLQIGIASHVAPLLGGAP